MATTKVIVGQAQALIRKPSGYANAQGTILRYNVLLEDTATRFADSWTTPDIGPAYTNYAIDDVADTSPFSANGTELTVDSGDDSAINPTAVDHSMDVASIISATDFMATLDFSSANFIDDFTIELSMRVTPNPSSSTGSAFDSVPDGRIYVSYNWNSSIFTIGWEDTVGLTGDSATFTYSTGFVQDDVYRIKVLAQGANISGKFWDISTDANEEEPDWEVTLTDSTILGPGYARLLYSGESINIDNITIVDLSTTGATPIGMAQALIKGFGGRVFGQAQAQITTTKGFGQALAFITIPFTNPLGGSPLGGGSTGGNPINTGGQGGIGTENIATPAQTYPVIYNGYRLPGYAFDESWVADQSVSTVYVADYDGGPLSEYTGLPNNTLTLKMLVIGTDYLDCKNQVQMAATILRTNNRQFVPLYLQRTDRYWEAMVKTISVQKDAAESDKRLEYDIDFEARPWVTSTDINTLAMEVVDTVPSAPDLEAFFSSNSDILMWSSVSDGAASTDQVTRGLDNGGWTPTVVTITGNNVTISGYTDSGDFTGFISASGAVHDLTISTLDYTAVMDGVNRNDLMNADYELYIGVGKTNFDVSGADICIIKYNDRWYL